MSSNKKKKYVTVINNKSKGKSPRIAQGSLKTSPMIHPKVCTVIMILVYPVYYLITSLKLLTVSYMSFTGVYLCLHRLL